jgi:hypothetical protein
LIDLFAELGEVIGEVELIRPDKRIIKVKMRSLSEQDIFEVRASMTWPKAPKKLWAKITEPSDKSRDGNVVQVPDDKDPQYLKETEAANRLYIYRLLARSLVGLDGTLDERVSLLQQHLGGWAHAQLLAHLWVYSGVEEAEVEAKAESFHGNGLAETTAVAREGLDA